MEQPALRARSERAVTRASFALKATCESCNLSTTVIRRCGATIEAQNAWKVKESHRSEPSQPEKLAVGSAACRPPICHARPIGLGSLLTAHFQLFPPRGYLALKACTFLRKAGLSLAQLREPVLCLLLELGQGGLSLVERGTAGFWCLPRWARGFVILGCEERLERAQLLLKRTARFLYHLARMSQRLCHRLGICDFFGCLHGEQVFGGTPRGQCGLATGRGDKSIMKADCCSEDFETPRHAR